MLLAALSALGDLGDLIFRSCNSTGIAICRLFVATYDKTTFLGECRISSTCGDEILVKVGFTFSTPVRLLVSERGVASWLCTLTLLLSDWTSDSRLVRTCSSSILLPRDSGRVPFLC